MHSNTIFTFASVVVVVACGLFVMVVVVVVAADALSLAVHSLFHQRQLALVPTAEYTNAANVKRTQRTCTSPLRYAPLVLCTLYMNGWACVCVRGCASASPVT